MGWAMRARAIGSNGVGGTRRRIGSLLVGIDGHDDKEHGGGTERLRLAVGWLENGRKG